MRLKCWRSGSVKTGTESAYQGAEKGTKKKLVELAARNARMVLTQDKEKLKREEGRTIGDERNLRSSGTGQSAAVESYDISNISGFESVGSMVVYEKGKPKRNDYRKFRSNLYRDRMITPAWKKC